MTLRAGLIFLGLSTSVLAGDSSLSLADLEAYRVALSAKAVASAPLVKFRDLWDHPDKYSGCAVRVEGQLVRLFRQPRIGEFPPLVEAWMTSAVGDPFCLVFPDNPGETSFKVGDSIQFKGTFLKRLKYQGGDTERVAPLIVGPQPPTISASKPQGAGPSWSSIDWMVGLGAAAVVGLVLVRRHLSRPAPHPVIHEPPPIFLDGAKDSAHESDH